MFIRFCNELFFKLDDVFFFDHQAGGVVVSSKVEEEAGVFFELGENGVFGNGSDRSFSDSSIDCDDEGGAVILFGEASGDDWNNAGVPLIGVENDRFL